MALRLGTTVASESVVTRSTFYLLWEMSLGERRAGAPWDAARREFQVPMGPGLGGHVLAPVQQLSVQVPQCAGRGVYSGRG